jgi:hypothetical protein
MPDIHAKQRSSMPHFQMRENKKADATLIHPLISENANGINAIVGTMKVA